MAKKLDTKFERTGVNVNLELLKIQARDLVNVIRILDDNDHLATKDSMEGLLEFLNNVICSLVE